uniref:Uncharacterized protein n=1 Tax=Glossina austeni TaxID=7395 RepID=A0A1A9UYQ6_GLOAU
MNSVQLFAVDLPRTLTSTERCDSDLIAGYKYIYDSQRKMEMPSFPMRLVSEICANLTINIQSSMVTESKHLCYVSINECTQNLAELLNFYIMISGATCRVVKTPQCYAELN